MPPPRTISKRTFQLVALLTLPLPFAATVFTEPHLPRMTSDSDEATLVRVLLVVLVLLGFVILWAAALLPLRRRSAIPTLAEEMSAAGVSSLGALYDKARDDQRALASAREPHIRRRYHLRMAAAGALVAVVSGAVTALMLTALSETFFFWFPVASVVSAVLSAYHLARGLSLPSR